METKIVFFLCLVNLALASAAFDDLKLELASVVFRHGDRSPGNTFPTDPYKESDWPQGYGQLSLVGMQMQKKLGQLLKARYTVDDGCTGLTCANYTRVQVKYRSTDIDRTLMSAYSQLSGFFPPDQSQTFDPSLPWQPIPVHTVSAANDYLLLGDHVCRAYYQLLYADRYSQEYQNMEAQFKDFLENISKLAGMDVTLDKVLDIYDVVYIESVTSGKTPPSWVTPDIMTTLENLTEYTTFYLPYRAEITNRQKNRLTAGLWLGTLLENMKHKVNPVEPEDHDMKVFMYSAHDTTVAAMTSALGVYSRKRPGYATAFAVELYSDSNQNYYVRLFIRNGPDSDTFDPLTLTSYGSNFCQNATYCTLDEFEKYVTPLIPSDIDAECTPTASPTAKIFMDLEWERKFNRLFPRHV